MSHQHEFTFHGLPEHVSIVINMPSIDHGPVILRRIDALEHAIMCRFDMIDGDKEKLRALTKEIEEKRAALAAAIPAGTTGETS